MAEVDILLASYNGEKFIAEQIDSLLAQTFQDFRILIRDDGSNDKTPEIIAEYEHKYPDKIKIIHDDAICKNPTKNFFQLMKYAEADYVMFCDQDDVWLPYKVQIELDYMKKAERENPGKPVCVFTGTKLVDVNLKSMDKFSSLSLKEHEYKNPIELLLGNKVSGCTMMINCITYENVGKYSKHIDFHDWWIALYTSFFGILCHVPMALILYRRHAGCYTQFGLMGWGY